MQNSSKYREYVLNKCYNKNEKRIANMVLNSDTDKEEWWLHFDKLIFPMIVLFILSFFLNGGWIIALILVIYFFYGLNKQSEYSYFYNVIMKR